MSEITAPIAATHPAQIEPVFSTCQREDERDGQTLTVSVFFAGGTHDSETGRLGDYGNWIPAEEVTECQERLERILRRRHQARLADESKSGKDEGIYR